jgi:DNA-binding FadR family transcriptional regulator
VSLANPRARANNFLQERITAKGVWLQNGENQLANAVRKPRPQRIHQAIAARLGTAILAGDYVPGDILSGEIEQSAALDVSRTAYREAIRILTAKGLVESRPKMGTRITPRAQWNLLDPEMLGWMFSGEPDPGFICDLFELRELIEPAAAKLAAARRTAHQLAMMKDALEGMEKHGLSTHEGQEADQHFHRVLLEAAHNEALATLASSIGAAVSWTTRFKQRHNDLPRDPVADHIAVYEAIADGNAERARAAMTELLRLALQDMSGV